jgi:hypothetical protein
LWVFGIPLADLSGSIGLVERDISSKSFMRGWSFT